MYLIDTCTVSDFIKGHSKTLIEIKSKNPGDLFLSSISLMEIEFGLKKNPQKALFIQDMLHDFLKSIQLLEFGIDEARSAGLLRANLMKMGTPIGPYDLLIAATALHHNLKVVTSNVSEFQRVKGLICENWR
jgi:tRNA(fMet)-specific endonuclease VapC